MQLRGLPRPFYHAARLHIADLSPKAQQRMRWLGAWEALHRQRLTSEAASLRCSWEGAHAGRLFRASPLPPPGPSPSDR